MKKRLIALMIGATITATTMAGCSGSRTSSVDKPFEQKIRKVLEYDANVNIPEELVTYYGFELRTEIIDEKFYITFVSKKDSGAFSGSLYDDVKITYEVDKDTYYDFRHNYDLVETDVEVGMVESLAENFDPTSVEQSNVNGEFSQ